MRSLIFNGLETKWADNGLFSVLISTFAFMSFRAEMFVAKLKKKKVLNQILF